jgi:hypothetical protein
VLDRFVLVHAEPAGKVCGEPLRAPQRVDQQQPTTWDWAGTAMHFNQKFGSFSGEMKSPENYWKLLGRALATRRK